MVRQTSQIKSVCVMSELKLNMRESKDCVHFWAKMKSLVFPLKHSLFLKVSSNNEVDCFYSVLVVFKWLK